MAGYGLLKEHIGVWIVMYVIQRVIIFQAIVLIATWMTTIIRGILITGKQDFTPIARSVISPKP
jgi:hypothetical protein